MQNSSEKQREQFDIIIKCFTGALKSLTYYPSGHPAILQPIEHAIELLKPHLSKREQIVLGRLGEAVVFEGFPFYQTGPAVIEIAKILQDNGIEKVIFKQGITSKELMTFFEFLQRDTLKDGSLFKALERSEIVHISFEALPQEIFVKAKEVYTVARGIILDIMTEARIGRMITAKSAKNIVKEMSGIMVQEKSALLGLTMIQDHDEYTFNHCVNVGILALALAETLKFEGDTLQDIGLAGMLHDIGKTYTPKEIISKPGKLSDDEWTIIKKHPVDGAKIIKMMEGVGPLPILIVYEHHAKFNLKGYPGLETGRVLHPGTRILAIADCYDSMTTLRPYQRRFDPKEAIMAMEKMSGKDFDPAFLKTFIDMLGIYPIGSLVRLNTNEIGIVSRINPDDNTMPYVKIIYDGDGNRTKQVIEVCLADTDPNTGRAKREIIGTAEPVLAGMIDTNPYFLV